MIDWISVKDRMPTERGIHLLYSEDADHCLGPIPWIPGQDGKDGIWCDFFATPEAGHAYSPENGVTHWATWNAPATSAPEENNADGR